MLEAGMEVMYGKQLGEVTSVLDDMVLVKMAGDGKEYSLPRASLAIVNKNAPKEYTKLQLKRMEFLNDFAKDLKEAGVDEIVIRNGAIVTFNATESLEEKIQKAKDDLKAKHDEELKAAEEKIRSEEEENK